MLMADKEKELFTILKEFGASCYWYGEDTGDYDMDLIDKQGSRTSKNKIFYKDTVSKLRKLFLGGHDYGRKER